MKIDDRILQILGDTQSHDEWDIASRLYDWSDSNLRSKRGAWIRCIVQALWRMYNKGWVGYFWVSHGEGIAGDRIWFRSRE